MRGAFSPKRTNKLLTARFGRRSRLVGFDVRPEAMLICNVANLPEHAVLVLVAVAALDLHGRVALFLLPLLVAFVINHFVAVFVRVELVMLVVLVVLFVGLDLSLVAVVK